MTQKQTTRWENFSINSPEFIRAEKDSSIPQLLHNYFSRNSIASYKFICELSDRYPDLLLRSIRLNRAFLKPEHLDSLKHLKEHSNIHLSNHYKFFSKLAILEKELFDVFKTSLNECITSDILNVLIWISFWFEEKRASLFETQSAHIKTYDIHPFTETVDFFLSHYLFDSKDKIKNTVFANEQDMEALMTAMIEAKSLNNVKTNHIWQTLDKAHTYLGFLKSTVEVYSFDMNYNIEIEKGIVTLKYNDENKLKRWLIECEKLNYWYEHYRFIATQLVNIELENNPNFIKNKSGIDYLMNLEGAIRATITSKIAYDYCLDDSTLFDVPTPDLIKVLNGFVINAWGRFVEPMDKLNYLNPKKWLENMGRNSVYHSQFIVDRDGKQLSALPSRFSDKEALKRIIQYNVSNSELYSDNLINLLSFDINSIQYIDRLKPPVNLTGKPFIKLNNFYFAFNGILGETNSQINILINAMESNRDAHSKVMKSETDKMEENLYKMFFDAGFKNSDFSKQYHIEKKVIGDFDILIYESGVLVLIELKRSKIRIHLSDAHDEFENNLAKASKQLEKADSYIKDNFNKCKTEYFQKLNIKEKEFSQLKFYPLIVSTSFEHDHTMINNKHFKVSLFELQNVLIQEIDPIIGNRLEGLVMKLLRNNYWESLEAEFELPDLDKYTLKMVL
jgi:hypothetical protein